MNQNIHIDRTTGLGWAIAWAKVSKRGKIKVRKYLTHFEEGQSLDQWLPLFGNEHQANAYILANAPGPAPQGLQWAVMELTVYGLLVTLLDHPHIEAVVCNPHSEEANVLPAAQLIAALSAALGEKKGPKAA
jgi:hypothetical protein